MDEQQNNEQPATETQQSTNAASSEPVADPAVESAAASPTVQLQLEAEQPPAAQPTAESSASQAAVAPDQTPEAVPGAPLMPPPGATAATGAPVTPGEPGVPVTPPPSATGALVCGILAIVFSGFPIVGIALGIVAIVLAGKYYAAGGTQGTGKAGRICGIIGIICSVIMIIVATAMIIFGLSVLDEATNSSYSYSTTAQSSSALSSSYEDLEAEEEAIFAVVDPEMDKIKELDPVMVVDVSRVIEDSMNDMLEYVPTEDGSVITFADLQLDPIQVAETMMTGFDYEHSYANIDGTEGEANYEVTMKSITTILSDFTTRAGSLTDNAGSYTSVAEVYVDLGKAFLDAVNAAPIEDSIIVDVDLENVDGQWVIDQESWDDELESLFGF